MTENALVILMGMFVVSGVASGLGIAVGVRLGKDRTKGLTIMNLDSILRIERIVDDTNLTTHEQRNKALLENIRRVRKEVAAL